jgi:hypothetical protein
MRTTMASAADTHLTPEEFQSLSEVAKGLTQRVIPAEHKAVLLRSGLTREAFGGLMLTNAGTLRVNRGR